MLSKRLRPLFAFLISDTSDSKLSYMVQHKALCMRTLFMDQMGSESDKIIMSSRRSIERKEEIELSEQLDIFGVMIALLALRVATTNRDFL